MKGFEMTKSYSMKKRLALSASAIAIAFSSLGVLFLHGAPPRPLHRGARPRVRRLFAWNEYFLASLLTSTLARTTPPFLGSFVDGRGQFLAVLSAASTLAVLHVVLAGWLAQKRLVTGLAMGAIK